MYEELNTKYPDTLVKENPKLKETVDIFVKEGKGPDGKDKLRRMAFVTSNEGGYDCYITMEREHSSYEVVDVGIRFSEKLPAVEYMASWFSAHGGVPDPENLPTGCRRIRDMYTIQKIILGAIWELYYGC